MKLKRTGSIIITAMLIVSLIMPAPAANAADLKAYEVTVIYNQSDARTMLGMINSFRHEKDVWYWNEDDSTKTTLSELKDMVYDYNLERIAMLRALELISSYSHLRPNGEDCSSLYTGSYTLTGENIAFKVGRMSASDAFNYFRGEDKKYEEQENRRNMLSEYYGAVGIAHLYYKDCHFWVQAFGNAPESLVETAPNDSETKMEVLVDTANISEKKASVSSELFVLKTGESIDLPVVSVELRTNDMEVSAAGIFTSASNSEVDWYSDNENVLKIENGRALAQMEGTAQLIGDYEGQPLTINVKIEKGADIPTPTPNPQPNPEPEPEKEEISLKLGKKKYNLKYKAKAQSIKLSVKAEGGKPSYKSNKAKVKVSKNGKVTVAKKFKGTAKITVSLKGKSGEKISKKITIVVK